MICNEYFCISVTEIIKFSEKKTRKKAMLKIYQSHE